MQRATVQLYVFNIFAIQTHTLKSFLVSLLVFFYQCYTIRIIIYLYFWTRYSPPSNSRCLKGFGTSFSDHKDSVAGLGYTSVLVHVPDLKKKKVLDVCNGIKELFNNLYISLMSSSSCGEGTTRTTPPD